MNEVRNTEIFLISPSKQACPVRMAVVNFYMNINMFRAYKLQLYTIVATDIWVLWNKKSCVKSLASTAIYLLIEMNGWYLHNI